MRWWQFGWFGGAVLSLATVVKAIGAVVLGKTGDFEWIEAAGFAAAIFGMGFVCGVTVWLGKGMYQRLGMVGDAIVGRDVNIGAGPITCNSDWANKHQRGIEYDADLAHDTQRVASVTVWHGATTCSAPPVLLERRRARPAY